MSGITITKEGVWVSSENDFMKLFDMFGEEGLNLELENSLLAKLDTMQPFLA